MSLEEEILAAGRRVRDLAHEGALKVRKSNLVQELEKIEEKLAQIGGHKIGVEPVTEEQAAPKKAEPKAKSQAAKSTGAKS